MTLGGNVSVQAFTYKRSINGQHREKQPVFLLGRIVQVFLNHIPVLPYQSGQGLNIKLSGTYGSLLSHFYVEILWLLWASAHGSSPQEWGPVNSGNSTKQMHISWIRVTLAASVPLSVLGPTPVAPVALLTVALQESKPVENFCAVHARTLVSWLQFLFLSSCLWLHLPPLRKTSHQWDTPALCYTQQVALSSLLRTQRKVFFLSVSDHRWWQWKGRFSRQHTPHCSTSLFSYSTI